MVIFHSYVSLPECNIDEELWLLIHKKNHTWSVRAWKKVQHLCHFFESRYHTGDVPMYHFSSSWRTLHLVNCWAYGFSNYTYIYIWYPPSWDLPQSILIYCLYMYIYIYNIIYIYTYILGVSSHLVSGLWSQWFTWEKERVNPLITGVITHLLSGMSHQVYIYIYLVGGFNLPLWKMMDFVSWELYFFPNWMESHKSHVPVTTNQIDIYIYRYIYIYISIYIYIYTCIIYIVHYNAIVFIGLPISAHLQYIIFSFTGDDATICKICRWRSFSWQLQIFGPVLKNWFVGENLNRKPWFLPSDIGLSCKFSHHPILWQFWRHLFSYDLFIHSFVPSTEPLKDLFFQQRTTLWSLWPSDSHVVSKFHCLETAFKSVASRACCKLLEQVKSVASRGCYKLIEQVDWTSWELSNKSVLQVTWTS